MIEASDLRKAFRVPAGGAGIRGGVRGLLTRTSREVEAVAGLSFAIEQGEMVGCVGPNGAGKSTTVKMLTGILVPTSGEVRVLGLDPARHRRDVARRVGVVFGQRTQLWWDLPLLASLDLLRHMYRVPPERFRQNLALFKDLLDLKDFLETPVRQLSLGQRMRGDLAAALLHDPEVLYLDEPTIGLDVVAKARLRAFLREINRERHVTLLLTTHDMDDITSLCSRLMIIDHGGLIYDGGVEEIRTRYGERRILVVDLDEGGHEAAGAVPFTVPHAALIRAEGPRRWLSFRRDDISASDLIAMVAARYRIRDLTLEEPDIEGIVRRIYEDTASRRTPA
ncbi:MAG: ATP-binding cassette domain-containing protein [Chloroflexota bacterium]